MILIITSFIFIISFFLYKKERFDLLYIPIIIESILLFILSFIPNLNVLSISWIASDSWTILVASIISAIAALITYVEKEKSVIWYYHLVLLLLLMINNKYILSMSICVCLLTEVSRRIKDKGRAIRTNFIVIMPLLLSLTAFSENTNVFNTYIFLTIAIVIFFVDFYKITVYRVFALLGFANLVNILELNKSVAVAVILVGPIYLFVKLYIIFGKEKFNYKKVKLMERIVKKFIIERNSREKLFEFYQQPMKKTYKVKKAPQGILFENDIRHNFLLIITSFCIIALYLLVRS